MRRGLKEGSEIHSDIIEEVSFTPASMEKFRTLFEERLLLEDFYDEIYQCDESDFSFDMRGFGESKKTLELFSEEVWQRLDERKKIESVRALYQRLAADLNLKRAPELYFVTMKRGVCGGYDEHGNRIFLNRELLDSPTELVDTIAHELWHVHQAEEAHACDSKQGQLYRLNFENYITPAMDFCEYEGQLVEAEARAFSKTFCGRM